VGKTKQNQKQEQRQKQRGSKTICILLCLYIWGRVNSPFLVLLLFHISLVAAFLLFADVCACVWKPILNLLPLLSSYGAHFLALRPASPFPPFPRVATPAIGFLYA